MGVLKEVNMSKGPSGVKDEDIKFKHYYNLKLELKDWCRYHKGVCGIVNNINGNYCWACKYRRPLEIPKLLEERG